MREIKFRVWFKGTWDYEASQTVEYLTFDELCDSGSTDNNDFAWMQYTGLKDKNGKEIYEGDIVKPEYGDIGEVKFVRCWFYIDSNFAVKSDELLGNYTSNNIEVIGNIYEHPLLAAEEG